MFTPVLFRPYSYHRRQQSEIAPSEFAQGVKPFLKKISTHRPRMVVLLGLNIANVVHRGATGVRLRVAHYPPTNCLYIEGGGDYPNRGHAFQDRLCSQRCSKSDGDSILRSSKSICTCCWLSGEVSSIVILTRFRLIQIQACRQNRVVSTTEERPCSGQGRIL